MSSPIRERNIVRPFDVEEGELEPGMPPSQEFEGLRVSVSAEFSSPTSQKVSEFANSIKIEAPDPSKWKKRRGWMIKLLPEFVRSWRSPKKGIPTSSIDGRERPKNTKGLDLYSDDFWENPSGKEGVKRVSSIIHPSESDEKGALYQQSKEIQRLERHLPKKSPDRKDWLSQNYWDDPNAESTLVGEKDPSALKPTIRLTVQSPSKPFGPAENDESTLLGEEDPSSLKPALKPDGQFVLDLPHPSASQPPVQKSQKPSQADSKPFDPAEKDESTLLGEEDPSGLKPALKPEGEFVLVLPHPSASQPPVQKSHKPAQSSSKPFDPAENEESTLFGEEDPSNLPISPKLFERPSGAFVLDEEKRPSGKEKGNGISLSFHSPLNKAKTFPPPDFHEAALPAKENDVDEYENTDDDPAQVRSQQAAAKPYIMRPSAAGFILDLERLGDDEEPHGTPASTVGYEPKRSMTQSLRSLFKPHHASSSSSSHLPDVEGETQGPDADGEMGLPKLEEGDVKYLGSVVFDKFTRLVTENDGAYVLALMKLCDDPKAKCTHEQIQHLKAGKWLNERGQPINSKHINKYLEIWCLKTLKAYLKSIKNQNERYTTLENLSNMCLGEDEDGFSKDANTQKVMKGLKNFGLMTKKNVFVTRDKIRAVLLKYFDKYLSQKTN